MKEFISREILYFITALFVSIPTGILFASLMRLKSIDGKLVVEDSMLETDFLIIGAILGFIGVYFIRLIMWAVKNVLLN